MANNNQGNGMPQLPNPMQLLSAPMSVLDAQAKVFVEGLTNMLNMGSASVSTMMSSLQAPLAQPTEPLKDMLLMPLNMVKQVATPFMAGVPGAPTPTPTPTVGEYEVSPPAAPVAPMTVAPTGATLKIIA